MPMQYITVLLVIVSHCSCKDKENLFFQLYVSNSSSVDASVGIPAINYALQLINNDSSLLPNYNLTYIEVQNPECNPKVAVKGFFEEIRRNTTSVLIVGPDCTGPTEAIASLAQHWNLVTISTGSISPSLSDNFTYPFLLRVSPSAAGIAGGLTSLMKQFNWKYLGIITVDIPIFRDVKAAIVKELQFQQKSIIEDIVFLNNHNPQQSVRDIHASAARIIYINTYHDYGREIMCQAASLGMFYPDYVWIVPMFFSENFWRNQTRRRERYTPFTQCTEEALKRIIKGLLVVDYQSRIFRRYFNETTIIGNITMSEFESEILARYKKLKNENVDSLTDSNVIFASLGYDTMWTGAMALHGASQNPSINLSSFTYENDTIRDAIYKSALGVNFTGATNKLKYDGNGDRTFFSYGTLHQHRTSGSDLIRTLIANISLQKQLLFFHGESPSTIFPDGTPVDRKLATITVSLFIVCTCLAVIGIIYALACIAFILGFRKKETIRLTSPLLNATVGVGAIVIFVATILLGVDEGTSNKTSLNVVCQLNVWLISIGTTLIYVPILAKAWRVYLIFRRLRIANPNTKKKTIQDWHLFILILIFLAVDIGYLVIITALPSTRLSRIIVEVEHEDGRVPSLVGKCVSSNRDIWLGILIGYKCIELLCGLFLAFETRNVKIEELNESKFIGFCIYTIIVTVIALVPVGVFVSDQTIWYAITGLAVMAVIIVILSLIFIPKMLGLYKNPSGKWNGDRESSTRGNTSTSVRTKVVETEEFIKLKEYLCKECNQRIKSGIFTDKGN